MIDLLLQWSSQLFGIVQVLRRLTKLVDDRRAFGVQQILGFLHTWYICSPVHAPYGMRVYCFGPAVCS